MYFNDGSWVNYPFTTPITPATTLAPAAGVLPGSPGYVGGGAGVSGSVQPVAPVRPSGPVTGVTNDPVPNSDGKIQAEQRREAGYRGPSNAATNPNPSPTADQHDEHGNVPGQNGSGVSTTGPHLDALQPAPVPAPAPNAPRN